MKRILSTLLFTGVLLSINSCRQDEVTLSTDDVTNLQIIQNKRIKTNIYKTDSISIINLKQDELVKPPK